MQKIFRKLKELNIIYEVIIMILAIVAVLITFLNIAERISIEDSSMLQVIDNSILGVFIIDYFVRLILAEKKLKFIKDNPFDLISIIPFNSMFRLFRTVRLLRILKVVKIVKILKFIRLIAMFARVTKKISRFLNTNGFIYSLYVTFGTIILGAIGIYIIERDITINSFGDALWWSFVTTTTVGYGDISPETGLGRIIAVVLMLVGIGFLGMVTGTIATYFVKGRNVEENVQTIEIETVDISGLSLEQKKQVKDFVIFLKNRDPQNL